MSDRKRLDWMDKLDPGKKINKSHMCESTAAEAAEDMQRMYVAGKGWKAGHKAPQERPTQRAAESGPQDTAQAANTEDRRTTQETHRHAPTHRQRATPPTPTHTHTRQEQHPKPPNEHLPQTEKDSYL